MKLKPKRTSLVELLDELAAAESVRESVLKGPIGWFYEPDDSEKESDPPQKESPLPNTSEPPWEQIPDRGYDRTAIKLLHKGYPAKEIGRLVGNKDEKTILNNESKLRKKYGPRIIPYRRH